MKILVLGSGGREHALAMSICKSPLCEKVFIAPGNGGTDQIGENVSINPGNFDEVAGFVAINKIELVVVGPEDPLVYGIVDFFETDSRTQGVPIFGPKKAAAMLEGSKAFAKAFMNKHNIPTADYKEFSDAEFDEAKTYLEEKGAPIVLKADGLAAGKGVRVCFETEEAINALEDILLDKKYGAAGAKVVIEQFLDGVELSVFAICDGKNYKLLPTAKDYKRIGEGDTGLNTGGMGAISPVPFASDELMAKVKEQVVDRTMEGLKEDGLEYRGFLYFGLINCGGDPYVIEYNCRMGDPETEAVLPRVKSDLLPEFINGANGNLDMSQELEFIDESATTVILVSGGYPEAYEKGKGIKGIPAESDSIVFHAGTKKDHEVLKTSGGRVLAITSFDLDPKKALEKSYAIAEEIRFEGKYYRKDIGFDIL
ncbi:MAG: phosphoribosylamine--glycine ligase [Bacteroidia bacterium]